jgi:hypothetical protein
VSADFVPRDITGWQVRNPEPLGREAKVWVQEPGSDSSSRERFWLFKPVVVPEHGHQQGEDWAEKIVSELAAALGVPCAEVDLAVRDGVPGSISRNVAPDGWNLVLGSLLLGAVVLDYQEGQLRLPGRPGHNLANIRHALRICEPPPGFLELDAVGVFAGYLVLDAWVGNQDRHDQNWAVLRQAASPGGLCLAPSYDHASSLGFNLLDTRRHALLASGSVSTWAERGRAQRFEHNPDRPKSEIPSLVDVARDGLAIAGGRAERFWLDRLHALDRGQVESVVRRVAGLSDVTATFILELLDINRRRLLSDSR